MQPEQVDQLSNQFRNGAAYCLRHWCGMQPHQIDDCLDDVVQVAWCRYLNKPFADAFHVGKRAAQEYVRKNGAFYRTTCALTETVEAAAATSRDPLPQEISAELFSAFYAQRKPSGPHNGAEHRSGGQRRIAAAARDALIVDLLYQGYSDEGIALEIGTTYLSVRTYRKQIKNRLRKMSAERSN